MWEKKNKKEEENNRTYPMSCRMAKSKKRKEKDFSLMSYRRDPDHLL